MTHPSACMHFPPKNRPHIFSLTRVLKDYSVQHLPDGSITVESILIQATAHSEDQGTKVLLVSWTYQVGILEDILFKQL